MRWVLTWLLGLALGLTAALGLLYLNPQSRSSGTAPDGTTELSYEIGPGAVAFTHGDYFEGALVPRGTPLLWEGTIRNAALAMLALRNRAGETVALASRVVKLSDQTNPVTSGIVLASDWLVTVPGSGSYVIETHDNVWPLIRDTLVDVGVLRRPWTGPRRFDLTRGPDATGAGVVTGASGDFAGMRGLAAETIEIEAFTALSDVHNGARGALVLGIGRGGSGSAATPEADTP